MKHNPSEFLNSLREGLNEIESSAVILQLLPHPAPLNINEQELTSLISSGETVVAEEEVVSEEITTVMQMRDEFLKTKGIIQLTNTNDKMCEEFENYIKITQNRDLMMFDKTIDQGNTDFWMLQRQGLLTGSIYFYRICHLQETTNIENTLKDLLGYKCPWR